MNQTETVPAPVFPCEAMIKEEAYRRLLPQLRVYGLKGQKFTALRQNERGKIIVDPKDLRPGANPPDGVCAEIVELRNES